MYWTLNIALHDQGQFSCGWFFVAKFLSLISENGTKSVALKDFLAVLLVNALPAALRTMSMREKRFSPVV